MEKDIWDNLDWGNDMKNDWSSYVTKEYIDEKVTLPTVLDALEQINEDDEIFLKSELDEIEKMINRAISRKERGIIGEANILQEEREKTINEIIKD
tara:strand:- start:11816 stop:12103 length:288 start_codon:yes stop_codon:yes gene_type:complete